MAIFVAHDEAVIVSIPVPIVVARVIPFGIAIFTTLMVTGIMATPITYRSAFGESRFFSQIADTVKSHGQSDRESRGRHIGDHPALFFVGLLPNFLSHRIQTDLD